MHVMDNDYFFQVSHLNITYGTVTLLDAVNLSLPNNVHVSIQGSVGTGKTSLIRVLGLLEAPSQGAIHIAQHKDCQFMHRSEQDDLIRHYFAYVFQTPQLIWEWNALENIQLFMTHRPISVQEKNHLAMEYCQKLRIHTIAHRPVHSLSGGEKQLVSIARALVKKPKILILDEPTASLDTKKTKLALQLLTEYVHQEKALLIMVTHKAEETKNFDFRFMIKNKHLVKID